MGNIRIREYVLADIDAYAAWQSDPDVARHVSWLPKNHAESLADLLDAIAQQAVVPRSRHFFAVVCMNTNEVVGNVGLTVTEPSTGDCGWFILRVHWGLGYATEAAQMLVKHAFQTLRLDRLTASCSVANPASERVMLKCGFKCIRRSKTRIKCAMTRDAWAPNAPPFIPANARKRGVADFSRDA